MEYKIIDTVFREKQFEIIYEISDDFGKLLIGGIRRAIGEKELDEKQLDVLFTYTIFPEFEKSQVIELVEKVYTKTEVENILVAKGFISEAESIEDLKTLAELKTIIVAEVVK